MSVKIEKRAIVLVILGIIFSTIVLIFFDINRYFNAFFGYFASTLVLICSQIVMVSRVKRAVSSYDMQIEDQKISSERYVDAYDLLDDEQGSALELNKPAPKEFGSFFAPCKMLSYLFLTLVFFLLKFSGIFLPKYFLLSIGIPMIVHIALLLKEAKSNRSIRR